jgi:hypothetical protein
MQARMESTTSSRLLGVGRTCSHVAGLSCIDHVHVCNVWIPNPTFESVETIATRRGQASF